MNYPNNYDNGKSCSWHITVDPDKVTRTTSALQMLTFATNVISTTITIIKNGGVDITKRERMWFFGSSSFEQAIIRVFP